MSAIEQFPSELKAWLTQRIKELNFGSYDQLWEELKTKLPDYGLEVSATSRSAIGRYGKSQKEAKQRLLEAMALAKELTEVDDDQRDRLGQANVALAQQSLMELNLSIQELASCSSDPDQLKLKAGLITKISHCAADVARASTGQKKWAHEVNKRLDAAAAQAEADGKRKGLSTKDVALIRDAIAGQRL